MLLVAGLLLFVVSLTRMRYAVMFGGIGGALVLCLMLFPPMLYALIVVGLALELTRAK